MVTGVKFALCDCWKKLDEALVGKGGGMAVFGEFGFDLSCNTDVDTLGTGCGTGGTGSVECGEPLNTN